MAPPSKDETIKPDRLLAPNTQPRNRLTKILLCDTMMLFSNFIGQELMNQTPDQNEIICYCFQKTESSIRKSIADGNLTTLEQVISTSKAGAGCSSCHMLIQYFIDQNLGKPCIRPPKVDFSENEPKQGFFSRLFGKKK